MAKKNKSNITNGNKNTYVFHEFYDQIKNFYSKMNLAELKFEITHRPGILQNPISSNYYYMLREILNDLIKSKTIASDTMSNR